MKKILTTVFASLAVFGCAIGFAACAGQPTYYTLTYSRVDGVEFISDVKSNAKVKEGYEVSFSLSLDEDCEGTPVVSVNNKILTADAEGKYSFVMSADTTVTVTGIALVNYYTITFDDGGERVTFASEQGNVEEGISVPAGEEVRFEIDVSVYYADTYSVLANTEIITPDENGVYSVYVTEDTNVTLHNLEQEVNFANRANGGKGTASDPYKIERPIDLFYMSVLINSDFYTTFYDKHYKLMNDIDMGGEELYVIGNATTSTAMFSGVFDGNGHTVSNYFIQDKQIDQESFGDYYYPYVGFFGYANGAQIYNLTLNDFTVYADESKQLSNFTVGGLVGFGDGVNISGCTVNGKIEVAGEVDDTGYIGYVGGIIGLQQSVYDNYTRYYSSVVSCTAAVDIDVKGGFIYAAGGITGYLLSGESKTTAYVLNCAHTGNISGAMRAGGVVGSADENTSIINCYSVGDVSATCNFYGVGYEGMEDYIYASAGGVVGSVENNSIVANCFASGLTSAYSTNGREYELIGRVTPGNTGAYVASVDAQEPLVLNSYWRLDPAGFTESYLKNTLGWSESDWVFSEGLPAVNLEEANKQYQITLNYGAYTVNGKTQKTLTVSNLYLPMSYWEIGVDGVGSIPEFVVAEGAGSVRSYGYFFDEELTQKVPYGYVPTGDTVLYVGFANYADVAGTYHVQAAYAGLGIELQLKENGTLVYKDGAIEYTSSYLYNGEEITLLNTCLIMASEYGEEYYGIYSFRAVLDGDALVISDSWFFVNGYALNAYREYENLVYGEYQTVDGKQVVFFKDRTAIIDGAVYIYEVTGTQITLTAVEGGTLSGTLNGDGYVGTVGSDSVSKLNAYIGVWQSASSVLSQLSVKANGEWTIEEYEYDGDGNKVVYQSKSGTYTVSVEDGSLLLNSGETVAFDKTGRFLEVYRNGYTQTYYQENSFAGEWHYFHTSEPSDLILNGIGKDGYGTAQILYNRTGETYDLLYEAVTLVEEDESTQTYLIFYLNGTAFASLTFSAQTQTLVGSLFSPYYGTNVEGAVFCKYDVFRGEWISEVPGLERISFDGKGFYNLNATDTSLAVKGKATINGGKSVAYTVRSNGLSGSFVYEGVTYQMSYDLATKTVSVTAEDGAFDLLSYDVWYTTPLVDGNGNTYTFDGRGALAGGGKLTVVGQTVGVVEYTYKSTANSFTIVGDETSAFTVNADGTYTLVLNGVEKTLTLKNDFTGKWLIGEVLDYVEIGAVTHDMKATGIFLGEEKEFTYNKEENHLTFTYEGQVMYLISLGTELALSFADDTLSGYLPCIPESLQDSWKGTYTAQNGNTLTFDGLSATRYGKGYAVLKDGKGEIICEYSYMVKDGVPVLSYNRFRYSFIAATSDTEEAFNLNNNYYRLIDALYEVQAEVLGVTYVFDGAGKVTCSDGSAYTYTIDSVSISGLIFTLTLEAIDGKVYTATLNLTDSENYTLSIAEKK